jgi:hypothetical protein
VQSIYKYSFILRLWRVEHSEEASWLASLEIPETGKRIGFASPEQMFVYLIDFIESNRDVIQTGENSQEQCDENNSRPKF